MSAAEPNSRKPLRKRSKPPMLLSSCGRQTQSSPRGFGTKRRSGGTLDAWSWVDLRYGNLAEAAGALKLMQSGKVSASRIGEAFVRARLDPTKAKVDHAVELATVRGRMLTEWQNSSARLASSVERTSY